VKRILLCLVFLLPGVAAAAAPVAEHGLMVLFEETEPGLDPYPTRMILTPRYLRIDANNHETEYVVFDRKEHVIYNVSGFNRAVLVIRDKPVMGEPLISLESKREDMNDPRPATLDGHPVRAFAFVTNGKVCWRVDTVTEGPLMALRDALAEFHRVLAGEQAAIAHDTPTDMLDACDLEHNVYRPDWYLQAGFPVRRDDLGGRVRVLREMQENFDIAPGMFELPADFRRFSREQVTGR